MTCKSAVSTKKKLLIIILIANMRSVLSKKTQRFGCDGIMESSGAHTQEYQNHCLG